MHISLENVSISYVQRGQIKSIFFPLSLVPDWPIVLDNDQHKNFGILGAQNKGKKPWIGIVATQDGLLVAYLRQTLGKSDLGKWIW